MFQIEQDEDNKELSFHLKNYDDDEENEEGEMKVNTDEEQKRVDQAIINDDKTTAKRDYQNLEMKKEIHEKIIKEENETDNSTVLHMIFLKGIDINIEGMPIVKFTKLKKENKLISFFKVSRFLNQKKKREEVNYLALFNEYFVYLIKDNLDGKNIKKIGNRYNLKLLSNINIKVKYVEKQNQEDGRTAITLSFSKSYFIEINPEKEERIVKILIFEISDSQIFMEYTKVFLAKINKPLQFEKPKK